jgi:radical SAM protein with 4Fe4S-binding SPASM domain
VISDRIDNITSIKPEYRKSSVPAPKSVKIELTGRCNFACSFCARGQNLREVADIDKSFFRRILKEMREDGVEEIGLFYLGESMMNRFLPEAIKYAKEIGFPYVFLTTNGSLATEHRVRECFEAGLDSMKFSLNYANERQFEDIARVKGKLFHKMKDNIKAAKKVRDDVFNETGHKCGLYASYIMYDGIQGKRMLDMVTEMTPYLDEIYALPLYGQAGPQDSPVDGKFSPTGGNTGRADNPVPSLPCWAAFQEGHITWDGKLSACCWDHTEGLAMGDLNEQTFMEAWNSDKFQSLRSAHLSGDVHGTACESCIYPAEFA